MNIVNPFFWICLGIVPFVCFGNIVMLIAVRKNPQICHNRGINIAFTVMLAVADLGTAFVTFPLKSMSYFIESDINKNLTLCLIGSEIISFTAIISGLSLSCIALEKYIRVLHPYLRTEITTKRCLIIVGVMLILAGGLSFSPAMGWNTYTDDMNDSFHCSKVTIHPLPYTFLVITCILISVVITTFCYSQIFITASRQQKQLVLEKLRFKDNQNNLESKKNDSSMFKKSQTKKTCQVHHNCYKRNCHLKIVKTGIMVLGPYFLTWVPSLTLTAIIPFKKDSGNMLVYMTLHHCCFILILLQACVNPVTYVLRMKGFRRALKNVFARNVNFRHVHERSNLISEKENTLNHSIRHVCMTLVSLHIQLSKAGSKECLYVSQSE
ncbi:unnamed protein product [Owenia fusiformis]|uniref:G-protein coupled receptors family 1 profile domain-containing protein n=1 Tax=Owenia fusiformis TaxID=6347 RepID=A0A8S4N2P1_OWEFU|nr:unnamed protein product [Owenia fusiformis]